MYLIANNEVDLDSMVEEINLRKAEMEQEFHENIKLKNYFDDHIDSKDFDIFKTDEMTNGESLV